jgi:hypothetical protein
VPQVDAPASAHWFSGSMPLGAFEQAPRLPGSAHDWQVPVQAVAQQTPCWQKPLAHSAETEHVTPGGFLVHIPETQTFGATQSASAVHEVRQVAPLQV